MNNYYVYIHKTKDGIPFYVGKGKGKRAWSNARNTNWKEYVNQIGEYDIELPHTNLSEQKALDIEKELIASIGITNLTNIMERGYSVEKKFDEFDKAEQSINDFINLCKLYYSL